LNASACLFSVPLFFSSYSCLSLLFLYVCFPCRHQRLPSCYENKIIVQVIHWKSVPVPIVP
jgi:hypothetical protein